MKLDSLGNVPTSDASMSYSFIRSDGRRCVAWRRYDGSFYVTIETEELAEPLVQAIRDGAVATLKQLLTMRAHVTQKNHLGWIPLHEAAANGKKECVDILVEAHPEVIDSQTLKGQTPLLLSVLGDHAACVHSLLVRGADPDISDKDGETPLHKACEAENGEIVTMLLDFGAGVDKQCLQGWTALHEAACRNSLQICQTLVTHGANVNHANIYGLTPLFVAAQTGHHEPLNFLLNNGADVNRQAADGATPLYEACKNGHSNIVELLLSHKADANTTCRSGVLPIHTAAQQGHDEIVSLLIPVTSRSKVGCSGISPLHLAAEHNYTDTLEILIQADFQVNAQLSAERSAMYLDRRTTGLYFTVINNNIEAASMLLKAGADPTLDHFSPLLVAVRQGCIQMVCLLVEHGANVNAHIPTHPTTFPATVLFSIKYPSMLKYLLDHGCDATACFQCEHGTEGCPAVRPVFRDDLGLNPEEAGIQFCDIITRPLAGPILHLLLDYVGNVHLCPRLTEYMDSYTGGAHRKDRAKPPRSLKHLSRLQVRQQVGVQRLRHLETLPLPGRLINYLNHQD